MIYLENFTLPSADCENSFFTSRFEADMSCYNTYYPWNLFRGRIPTMEFSPITFLYGGNGSGKTTILNVIAERYKLARNTSYNKTFFFPDYVRNCKAPNVSMPIRSRFIASDDVFQYVLELRDENERIDRKRLVEFKNHAEAQRENNWGFDLSREGDYEKIKKTTFAKSVTSSIYAKRACGLNIIEHSNGESAIKYFYDAVHPGGLYLLDEPENSLSIEKQLDFLDFLQYQSTENNVQFIIATHSPLLLSVTNARIYDLDSVPVCIRRWQDLENVRLYYKFFRKHKALFEEAISE